MQSLGFSKSIESSEFVELLIMYFAPLWRNNLVEEGLNVCHGVQASLALELALASIESILKLRELCLEGGVCPRYFMYNQVKLVDSMSIKLCILTVTYCSLVDPRGFLLAIATLFKVIFENSSLDIIFEGICK